MTITSAAFENNTTIPSEYTCDGASHNPPLTFSEVPGNAQSLVLIVDDPDSPSKTFTHWLLYNMPPATRKIPENEIPLNSMQGVTDFGKVGYGGPCPPSGRHRYFFKLFAMDCTLDLEEGVSKEEIEQAMKGHIIESTELVGEYSRVGL